MSNRGDLSYSCLVSLRISVLPVPNLHCWRIVNDRIRSRSRRGLVTAIRGAPARGRCRSPKSEGQESENAIRLKAMRKAAKREIGFARTAWASSSVA